MLERDPRYGSLRLTEKGWAVLKSREKYWGFPVNIVNTITEIETDTYNEPNTYAPELFEQLRAKRNSIADQERLPAYCIFHNKTLQAMARQLPQSLEEFRRIHGIGPAKTGKYADDFLPIIRDYRKKNGIESVESITKAPDTYDSTSKTPNEHSPELFELLRAERDKIFEREGDRVYEAFHDKALKAMATHFPISEESFIQISSVEPERFNKYADIFFPIIRAYCKEHRIDSTETKTGGLNTNDATSKKRDEYAHDLFEQLQDKCKTLEKAEHAGIFTDGTLEEMATHFPRTREAFAQIRGVSLRKMEKYADEFLPIIRAYCEEHGID